MISTPSLSNTIDSMIRHMHGYLVIKDLNSTFISGNLIASNEFGFKHPQELEGFTDFNMPHPLAEIGDFFLNLDLKLKQCNRPITGLYALPFHGQKRPFIFNKCFIKDEETNTRLIFSHAIECEDNAMLTTLDFLNTHDSFYYGKNAADTYFLNGSYDDMQLNEEESQCFFYLLRRQSATAISAILNSPLASTQETIALLLTKLECTSISQLIEKSIHTNYLSIVPTGIMHQLYGIRVNKSASNFDEHHFTARQQECISLLLKGLSLKEIANALHLSPRTIETHLNTLKQKLHCRNNQALSLKLSEITRGNRFTPCSF